ncbi:hypothetical protein [Stackebrandtia nassauensis]|uniref:Uncharacterized protein n=1 Tax=Stackebrandtia nassauensis (strain DSM 44728 / CIP 108903 / NRRL B-16338 / NBRC 102104 / LLR-40K-21) TaxID=446470 RepID=D3PW33_STANL|nr:hypothetical protein [Stackebrandtia nassauensis]ADD45154.1 hypothetical protein Snas_5523 [Stackebrandtia nassauensis DSM 44728]
MLTDYLRDALFTAAWFGLMTGVWLGWAQEDPPRRWRGWLGAGSVLGIACALGFGAATGLNWGLDSALEGKYQWFGVLVTVEVVLAGGGCWWLARTRRSRWMAWWVAVVVAAHFLPLGWMLDDASIAVAGVVQLVALGALVPRLRRTKRTTSALVGAVMGGTLLAYALITAAVTLPVLLSS